MLDKWFSEKLDQRRKENLLRQLKPDEGGIDFSSNDYLGLAAEPELHLGILAALENITMNGATGSRLLTGHTILHQEVEDLLASIFHADRTLIYTSGYVANLGVLGAIPQRGDTILYDERCHASLKEGLRLSQADYIRFKHNNAADLERLLQKSNGRKYVVVESVYSMDGDVCDFENILPVIQRCDAYSIVDEAHSTGVYGTKGNGLLNELALADQVDIRIYTFGKAMGVHGACVAGSDRLIEYLVNFSRPFIYTTAVPPAQLISIRESFIYLAKTVDRTNKLKRNIELFLKYRHSSGIPGRFIESITAIQGVSVSGNSECRSLAEKLQKNGFRVFPVLSPTVPEGKERIRICLHSFNTEEQIKKLIQDIEKWL